MFSRKKNSQGLNWVILFHFIFLLITFILTLYYITYALSSSSSSVLELVLPLFYLNLPFLVLLFFICSHSISDYARYRWDIFTWISLTFVAFLFYLIFFSFQWIRNGFFSPFGIKENDKKKPFFFIFLLNFEILSSLYRVIWCSFIGCYSLYKEDDLIKIQ